MSSSSTANRCTISPEHEDCSENRHDETACLLVGPVHSERPTDETADQRTDDAEQDRDDEPSGIPSRHQQLGDNADDQSTEYAYDSKGFRFVKYKVQGRTLNALRFSEVKKPTT